MTEIFTVTDQFQGARRGRCTVQSPTHVELEIRAEDDKVTNLSPWYSFKVLPSQAGTALITLQYFGAPHRYKPKLSIDGITWTTLDETNVIVSEDGMLAEVHVPIVDQPVWVSAQELITPPIYDTWNLGIARNSDAELSVLGHSRNGLPIFKLDTNPHASDVLLILGRQHPPEVSGAVAFFPFAETLLADTELARRFRQKFRIIAVPLINPDGVVAGHWRHNLGDTDLNRDWGPFLQPETQAVKRLLDELDENGSVIRMFADFHSTNRNLLYSQSVDYPTDPPGFTPNWLGNALKRVRHYPFSNEAAAVSEQANSKNYMFKRYGIPAVTFEVGDETDRNATRAAAIVFAEELMKLMLAQNY